MKDRVEEFLKVLIKKGTSVPEWNEKAFFNLVMDSYKIFILNEVDEIKNVVERMAEDHGIKT